MCVYRIRDSTITWNEWMNDKEGNKADEEAVSWSLISYAFIASDVVYNVSVCFVLLLSMSISGSLYF